MKIVRSGTQKRREEVWWVGRHHTCPSCGCEVQLELKDGKDLYRNRFTICYLCPECKWYVTVPKSTGAAT